MANAPYFYYSSVISWLRTEWKWHKSWAEDCYFPWQRPQPPNGKMTDIYDSRNWKKYSRLREEGNMGLILGADGVSLVEKGRYSLWPIVIVNANLPPQKRYPHK